MKLLISPVDEQEALEAIAGGANIIDVKNPKEGPLGANFPWVIKKIREITPADIEVSCTLGDLPNLPGSTALAALGAASTGVNYIKASLLNVKTSEEAIYLMKNIASAAREGNPSIKIAVAGFGDASRIGSVDPLSIPKIAHEAQVEIAMLDTGIKDGNNLLSFLNVNQLKAFVDDAHGYGLKVALAGSLKKDDLSALCKLDVDIIGIRGAACDHGDRLYGRITRKKVEELVGIIRQAENHCASKDS